MENQVTGSAWVYGDNVDTDVIIPARYLTLIDPGELAKHCMEDIDPTFATGVKKGDILVGGANFGCGSSREHAPLAILGSGTVAVVAVSFARIFFRNAINVGLPIVECRELAGRVKKGDQLRIDFGKGEVFNETRKETYISQPFSPFLNDIISLGGLVNYTKKRLATPSGT
ncbi:MAG: 3-isopropylmalate dehydratase small subunit [Planctomycetota bacterium]|jgi:3-isopropylmalate/(R)-2-methylmalate dehydratase small subunit|nr:3-isopropylmalate dehydratase small subunit [Planctomycetota bacterium]